MFRFHSESSPRNPRPCSLLTARRKTGACQKGDALSCIVVNWLTGVTVGRRLGTVVSTGPVSKRAQLTSARAFCKHFHAQLQQSSITSKPTYGQFLKTNTDGSSVLRLNSLCATRRPKVSQARHTTRALSFSLPLLCFDKFTLD